MSPVVSHFLDTVICDIAEASLLDKNQDLLMCVTVYPHIMKLYPLYEQFAWRQNIILSLCLCVFFRHFVTKSKAAFS